MSSHVMQKSHSKRCSDYIVISNVSIFRSRINTHELVPVSSLGTLHNFQRSGFQIRYSSSLQSTPAAMAAPELGFQGDNAMQKIRREQKEAIQKAFAGGNQYQLLLLG